MSQSSISFLPISENQSRFCQLAEDVLKHARQLGASDATVQVAESQGLSVAVRHQDIETIEQTRDRSLSVTVFAGHKRGSASTSDFSNKALEETVAAAWHIARYTAEDALAGLPDEADIARSYPDLALYAPWPIDAATAARLALRAERAALQHSPLITNSEGAAVDTNVGHFVMANSRGFLGGYPFSRHSLSASPIATDASGMQRDYWYSVARKPRLLESPEHIGRIAAQRTIARLDAQRIKTGKYPVLFDATLAAGLLGAFTRAVSGGALYRKTTFLLNQLGQPVFAPHIQITERPHVLGGLGSAPFDAEGVRTTARTVVADGVLNGYFLSSYTARKLGMKTTGNAGGAHNLSLRSSQTQSTDDLSAMLQKMGTGLYVTELIGQGVNYLTGDYSRGAFGYWVENGEIQHAVEEITIAGNLAQMFQQIVAVGADRMVRGTQETGSILIEQMAVAGA